MNEENKHVFYDSTSVWLSVNCDEGKLTDFKVDVPVRIDSTGAVPHLKIPGLNATFQASVQLYASDSFQPPELDYSKPHAGIIIIELKENQ